MKGYLAAMAVDLEAIEDPALAAAQRKLLIRHGGVPLQRGSARLAARLRSGPARLIRRLAIRVFANSRTQPAWAVAGRLGVTPPPSPWFAFRSASEALAWTFRFPRRPSRELRRLDWLRDTVHVREVNMPLSPGPAAELEEARPGPSLPSVHQ
jgi:hypothetical protein